MVWRRTKRYFRKQAKRAYNAAKKRYATPGGIGRLAKDVSMLKGLVNTEFKALENTATYSPILGTPTIIDVSSVAAGTGVGQRTGNSIRVKSHQANFRLERNPGAPTNAMSTIRISMVLDTEPQVGTPVETDIWKSTEPTALRNFESLHSRRFKVLMTRQLVLDGVQERCKLMRIYKRLNFIARFSGNTAATYSNNRLFMIIQTDNPTAVDLSVVMDWRTRFIDN